MSRAEDNPLASLAEAYGLELAYEDAAGRRQAAKREVLLAALRGLGVGLVSEADTETALREFRLSAWRRVLEPVAVAWADRPPELKLRLPVGYGEKTLPLVLRLETGEERRLLIPVAKLAIRERQEIAGESFAEKTFPLPAPLPPGLHHCLLETPQRRWECRLIAAPREAYAPPESPPRRHWGLFAPLYALSNRQGWGAGDFGDLEALLRWTRQRGGAAVATLPFLAAFLDQPCDPSPYAPVSRLFWNEFYLEIEKIPELEKDAETRALLASPEFERRRESQRRDTLVDYRGQMALKRQILERLQHTFYSRPSPRRDALQEFLLVHPQWRDYAEFRAAGETLHSPWQDWPSRMRSGTLEPADYDAEKYWYHLYVQWLAEEQVSALARGARRENLRLALDLPLGMHPQGYDTWRNPGLFAAEVSVGAPPDAFFTRGQDWGFPPLLPERSREQGHAYFLAALRRLLEPAGMLRIDHVMGFHRLFWIPRGFSPQEGCYLRYPAEEFYALLCLESQRFQTVLVGEDLGTVPPEVRPALSQHHILRSHVAPFEWQQEAEAPMASPPVDCVASLNTHDMPTFAGFWRGQDLEDRHALGLLDAAELAIAQREREELRRNLERYFRRQGTLGPAPEILDLLQACLTQLASDPSRWLLVNLEDLWAEPSPQNVPGTGWERPNWRRKAKYSLKDFSDHARLLEILQAVDRARRGEKNSDS